MNPKTRASWTRKKPSPAKTGSPHVARLFQRRQSPPTSKNQGRTSIGAGVSPALPGYAGIRPTGKRALPKRNSPAQPKVAKRAAHPPVATTSAGLDKSSCDEMEDRKSVV